MVLYWCLKVYDLGQQELLVVMRNKIRLEDVHIFDLQFRLVLRLLFLSLVSSSILRLGAPLRGGFALHNKHNFGLMRSYNWLLDVLS